jgi:ABC-type sugar transport system substrate-binding protein
MSRKFRGRAIGVSAIVAVGLALSACSSSSSSTSTSTTTPSSSKPAVSLAGKSIELIVGTKSDDFYVTMECGAEAEAAKLGVHLTVNGPPDFSVSEQAPILNAVAVARPNALIVAPTSSTALDPELQRIQSEGIKLIFVDTDSSDMSLGLSRITSNNLGGGELAADSLAAAIGDKGTVAVINVMPGISTTDARIQGFDQEMKAKYPGITVLPVQYDNDSTATAATEVEGDIAAHPNLSGIFATNVLSAEGAATGVDHAGKAGKVKLATFDADPQQIAALKSDTIQLAIAQDPYLEGEDGVLQAVNAITGKPVTASIGTPLVAITRQNMNQPAVAKYVYVNSCS